MYVESNLQYSLPSAEFCLPTFSKKSIPSASINLDSDRPDVVFDLI